MKKKKNDRTCEPEWAMSQFSVLIYSLFKFSNDINFLLGSYDIHFKGNKWYFATLLLWVLHKWTSKCNICECWTCNCCTSERCSSECRTADCCISKYFTSECYTLSTVLWWVLWVLYFTFCTSSAASQGWQLECCT